MFFYSLILQMNNMSEEENPPAKPFDVRLNEMKNKPPLEYSDEELRTAVEALNGQMPIINIGLSQVTENSDAIDGLRQGVAKRHPSKLYVAQLELRIAALESQVK